MEMENDPPDLFVFYGNAPTPFSVLLASRLKRQGIPYIVTIHTRLENLFRAEVSGRFSRRLIAWMLGAPWGKEAQVLFENAAALILLTEGDRKRAIARGLTPAERIHVIPSGINSLYFHPDPDVVKGAYPTPALSGASKSRRIPEAGGPPRLGCDASRRGVDPRSVPEGGAESSPAGWNDSSRSWWPGPQDLGGFSTSDSPSSKRGAFRGLSWNR
jgi:glycosyltransferase involved in cell wall biosynthesis